MLQAEEGNLGRSSEGIYSRPQRSSHATALFRPEARHRRPLGARPDLTSNTSPHPYLGTVHDLPEARNMQV